MNNGQREDSMNNGQREDSMNNGQREDIETRVGAVECARTDLTRALVAVGRAVSKRSAYAPVLYNVRVRTVDGATTITGTDLDITVTVTLEGGDMPAVLLPYVAFRDAVRATPARSTVRLVLEGDTVRVLADGTPVGAVAVSTLPASEFPAVPTVLANSVPAVKLDPAAFSRVAVAASKDDSRPILTGVLWTVVDGAGCLVATDSYRLSSVPVSDGPPTTDGRPLLVPARVAPIVGKMIGTVWAGVDGRELVCRDEAGTVVATRLIEGEFPRWESLFPTDPPLSLSMPAGKAGKGWKACTLSRGSGRPCRLSVAGGVLTGETVDEDRSGRHAVPVSNVRGEWPTIGVNPRLWRELLESMGDTVTVTATDTLKPVTLSDPVGRAIIMPIRINP